MALIKYDLFGIKYDKVQIAIDRLKAFEPEEGYFVAFSGGKDSQCIYHLCEMAGVKFDAHYSVTSVDPPELVRFIQSQYPDVSRDIPHYADGTPITMWNLIPRKLMPPTRIVRYCCEAMKECGGKERVTVTGVRWDESANRKANHGIVTVKTKSKSIRRELENANISFTPTMRGAVALNDDNDESRRMVEHCYRTHKTLLNPIVDWETEDVWEFLNDVAKVPHCSLYDDGFKRLGCIGCPMSINQEMEFARWPKYKQAYLMAFGKMIAERERRGIIRPPTNFDTPQSVMDWWLAKTKVQIDGQITLEDLEEFEDEYDQA